MDEEKKVFRFGFYFTTFVVVDGGGGLVWFGFQYVILGILFK